MTAGQLSGFFAEHEADLCPAGFMRQRPWVEFQGVDASSINSSMPDFSRLRSISPVPASRLRSATPWKS